jgi:hypothetical protein
MNVRFKVARGTVLSLSPGQTLRHWKGGPTDEGFSYKETQWHYDGDHLYLQVDTDSSDCDGPHSSHDEYIAIPPRSGEYPSWERISGYQRDIYAEMMGY